MRDLAASRSALRLLTAGALAVVAAVLLAVAVSSPAAESNGNNGSAAARNGSAAGGRFFAVCGQIAQEAYGLYLFDTQNSTMSLYEWVPAERKLRLLAARNTEFDLRLDDYNTTPSPREIKALVEQHRRLTTAPTQP
jgi:hypothetical protein